MLDLSKDRPEHVPIAISRRCPRLSTRRRRPPTAAAAASSWNSWYLRPESSSFSHPSAVGEQSRLEFGAVVIHAALSQRPSRGLLTRWRANLAAAADEAHWRRGRRRVTCGPNGCQLAFDAVTSTPFCSASTHTRRWSVEVHGILLKDSLSESFPPLVRGAPRTLLRPRVRPKLTGYGGTSSY